MKGARWVVCCICPTNRTLHVESRTLHCLCQVTALGCAASSLLVHVVGFGGGPEALLLLYVVLELGAVLTY
jgi:hypothetical protein